MNEPRPWLDDSAAPAELRRLLGYGAGPRPLDAQARERSRRRLAALASVPAAAGALLWIQHLALGAALGTAVSVGVVVGGAIWRKPAAPKVTVSARPPVVPARPSAAPRVPAPAPLRAPERAVNPPPAPRSATTPATRPSASALPEDDGVAREAALLEAARRTLGEPERALSLLARHQHEFPGGVLATERELLMIDALLRAGRRPEAEERGARLRTRTPGNFYEERLERLLGSQEK